MPLLLDPLEPLAPPGPRWVGGALPLSILMTLIDLSPRLRAAISPALISMTELSSLAWISSRPSNREMVVASSCAATLNCVPLITPTR